MLLDEVMNELKSTDQPTAVEQGPAEGGLESMEKPSVLLDDLMKELQSDLAS